MSGYFEMGQPPAPPAPPTPPEPKPKPPPEPVPPAPPTTGDRVANYVRDVMNQVPSTLSVTTLDGNSRIREVDVAGLDVQGERMGTKGWRQKLLDEIFWRGQMDAKVNMPISDIQVSNSKVSVHDHHPLQLCQYLPTLFLSLFNGLP